MPTKPCDLPCPKCGSPDICRTFRKQGAILESSWHAPERDQESSEFISRKNKSAPLVLKDCLTNVCRGCGYRWDVGPLAANPAKAKKAKTK